MHRPRLAILSFLGCLLLGFGGCAVETPGSLPVRSIYVEEAIGAPSPDLAQCADVIHDTSVRVLRGRGFVAAMEPSAADAFLRATWSARPSTAGMPDGRVSLRMSLVARDGTLLRAIDLVADLPAGFLTKERIADLVRTKLDTFAR
jgi:hypothetical protein